MSVYAFATQPTRCEAFLALEAAAIPQVQQRLHWKSALLTDELISDFGKAQEIFVNTATGGPLLKEVGQFLDTLTAEAVFEIYYLVSELSNVHREGYQTTLQATDEAIPEQGEVLELGCGTGLVCAYIAHDRPHRTVVAVDKRVEYFPLLTKRFERLRQPNGTLKRYPVEFGDLELPSSTYAAAIFNFSLFHLNRQKKREVLHKAWKALVPDGVLVVHDPYPTGEDASVDWGDIVASLSVTGKFNGFFYAILGALRTETFTQRMPDALHGSDQEIMETAELKTLIGNCGFDIKQVKRLNNYVTQVIGKKKR